MYREVVSEIILKTKTSVCGENLFLKPDLGANQCLYRELETQNKVRVIFCVETFPIQTSSLRKYFLCQNFFWIICCFSLNWPHWADSVIESSCPSVVLWLCGSVKHKVNKQKNFHGCLCIFIGATETNISSRMVFYSSFFLHSLHLHNLLPMILHESGSQHNRVFMTTAPRYKNFIMF